VIEQFVLLLF